MSFSHEDEDTDFQIYISVSLRRLTSVNIFDQAVICPSKVHRM